LSFSGAAPVGLCPSAIKANRKIGKRYEQRRLNFLIRKYVPSLTLNLTSRIEQVKRSDEQTGFVVLPKRWIVERTFVWLSKQRRLSKDYESLCDTSEAMVHLAMIRLMLAKLDT